MEIYRAQRLRAFIDYLRSEGKVYNDADFCVKIHKNRAIVSEIVNGRRNLTPQFASEVRSFFPELDPRWLLEKNCNRMTIDGTPVDSDPALTPSNPSVSSGELERLHRIIDQQQSTIDRLLRIIEHLQDGKDQD